MRVELNVVREAAEILRRVLAAVETGSLRAEGPVGAGVVRQLHGAVAALAALTESAEAQRPERAGPGSR